MRRSFVLLTSAFLFLACSDDGGDGPDSLPDAGAAAGEIQDARVPMLDASGPLIDAAIATHDASPEDAALREVPCVDEQFAKLMLFDVPAAGEVRQESMNAGVFETFIDATAGGLMVKQAFVYGRFTDSGLVKVAISDEQGFESSDWDIAFQRYVIRVNSGVGGPGNVTVGRTAPGTTFAGLTAAPSDLTYRSEAYFTDSCEFVADTGIMAPSTALSSFWNYTACLQMTHNVYVVKAGNGRHVKLEVLSYYVPENQKRCDETGEISQPSGAGNLRIKWAFLD